MKTRKGLTRGKSILYCSLQQFGIWLAAVSAVCLIAYSFISVKVESMNTYTREITYTWNLFSEDGSFDETESFDGILWDSLHDIIRYNVAKSQLEVNGAFDGEKVIDIRTFVNRRDTAAEDFDLYMESRNEDILTIQYYLKDLIRWNKYGVNYTSVTMPETAFVCYYGAHYYNRADGYLSEEEIYVLESLLGEDTIQQLLDTANGIEYYYIKGGAETTEYDQNPAAEAAVGEIVVENNERWRMHEALADILLDSAAVESVYLDQNGDLQVVVRMLEERYRPIDKPGGIQDCVYSWYAYDTACMWLEQAVEDISYNYNEYLGFQSRYGAENTNIAYHCEMSMMGETVRVSNSDLDSWNGLDSYYREHYGRYLIYRPEDMVFETNMGTAFANEETLFKAFSKYEYAYPETAHIWLGIDTSYPVEDILFKADAAYAAFHPYAYLVAALGGAGLLLWLGLLLFLSVKTGWRAQKGGDQESAVLKLSWFDEIPTELAAAIGAGTAFLLICAWISLFHYARRQKCLICAHRVRVAVLAGCFVLLCSLIFCLFWYSLLRRCKAHTLWKNSLLRVLWQKGIRRPVRAFGRLLFQFYDNSGVFFRSLFILGGIMGINLILGFFCAVGWGKWLLLIVLITGITDAAILSFWIYHHLKRKRIIEAIKRIREGDLNCQVAAESMHGENRQLAEAVNSIGAGIKTAVETSMKDERLKADLITNVSHDIKTPLTSIINYVDLLKREKIEQEPARSYIEVLENKSWRLKQLTDDLLEASKISSGNITLHPENINLAELLKQALGEFSEKFEEKNLTIVEDFSEKEVYIEADSRRMWIVVENLFNNICKYALTGTRVYLDVESSGQEVWLSMKNISAQALNIPAQELTERFIRGDLSRNTEGSGLGLSIAKNLVELQKGRFEIYLDGDLFKVTMTFPVVTLPAEENGCT